MIIWGCSGCVILSMGANVVAMCWYSGCNFMVFGIKYVFALFLCVKIYIRIWLKLCSNKIDYKYFTKLKYV